MGFKPWLWIMDGVARFHPDRAHGDAALASELTAAAQVLAEFEGKLVRLTPAKRRQPQ